MQKTNEFIGWIGIGKSDYPNVGYLDFGYAILKKFWNQGFATEALIAIIDMAWKETTVNKITGECRVQNVASANVMKKCGMHLESEFEEDTKKLVRYAIFRSP